MYQHAFRIAVVSALSITLALLLSGVVLPPMAVAREAVLGTAVDTDSDTASAKAALQQFNNTLRGFYANSRSALLAAERPLIIVGGETLTLLTTGGDTLVATYTPDVYHTLKSLVHVLLGVVSAQVPASDTGAERLRGVQEAIQRVRPHVGQLGLSQEQVRRQLRLLDAVSTFIDEAVAANRIDPTTLSTLMRTIRPLVMDNAREAAIAQLDRLHTVVTTWQNLLSAADWARLRVLVPGPRMPRAQNLQAAYFIRLLGEPAEGNRVIYTENTYDIQGVLDHLGVILIDRALSQLVFGNPYRMEQDLVGHVAADYLDRLLPGPPHPIDPQGAP